jgi:hypothetical protein
MQALMRRSMSITPGKGITADCREIYTHAFMLTMWSNIMSEDRPPEYYTGIPSPPKSSLKPTLLIMIGGTIVVFVLLCGASLLFSVPALIMPSVYEAPPSFEREASLLFMDCMSQNPDIDESTCEAWAQNISDTRSGLYYRCSGKTVSDEARYQCILDAGFDAPE